MARIIPQNTDSLSNPPHALLHRIITVDGDSVQSTIDVDGSSNTRIGTLADNHVKISPAGELSFEGTAGLIIPYMMQSDTTDQAIANVSNAQVLTFDTSDHIDGITKTSSSRFTIQKAGSYLISFSGIAVGATNKDIEVWLRVGGNDVANSNTKYTFKSTGGTAVIAVTFIYHFHVNDYFELWTWGNDTGNRWDATAAGTNPTRPATPSLIITCNYIAKD
jgi:hypothetical protein